MTGISRAALSRAWHRDAGLSKQSWGHGAIQVTVQCRGGGLLFFVLVLSAKFYLVHTWDDFPSDAYIFKVLKTYLSNK